jgi:ribulose-phosphate 3-epimerase
MKIAPSILSADFGRLLEDVKRVEEAGADLLHVDVMDGQFVPNITIGPLVVEALKGRTSLPLDVHLMICDPDRFVHEFIRAGAQHLSFHVEACVHLHRTVHAIKEEGVRAGVGINPGTSLSSVECILPDLDFVVLMSVNPGFGGQTFIPAVLPKIRALRQMIDEQGLSTVISVDGGINADTACLVRDAGADQIVAGSAIYGRKDIRQAILDLRG